MRAVYCKLWYTTVSAIYCVLGMVKLQVSMGRSTASGKLGEVMNGCAHSLLGLLGMLQPGPVRGGCLSGSSSAGTHRDQQYVDMWLADSSSD